MTTSAQIAANQANAQRSTGPKTLEGLAASARNNFRHGLAGEFRVLRWENWEEFAQLSESLRKEHVPATCTETLLVERMAQHYWLSQRALHLQNLCLGDISLDDAFPNAKDGNSLALYLRYQVTHERAFHKCLNDLLKLRAEKRKQEIGFESQERQRSAELRKEADHGRRAAAEKRKQEVHKWNASLAEAKLDRQLLQNSKAAYSEPGAQRRIVAAENAA